MTGSSLHTAEQVRAESELQALAAKAVDVLEIAPTINQMAATLFRQIEDCDTFAGSSGDSIFMATSLPIANAFIHYATSLDALNRARHWARHRWPDEEDPTSMLAVLTLMYIVREGLSRYNDLPEKRAVWERIHGRIENTLHGGIHAEVAVA